MANHKSSAKRARQTTKKNANNTEKRSRTRNTIKAMRAAISEGNKEVAQKLLPTVQKYLARLAKIGVIKKNAVARKTSRMACQIGKL